jgi:hypothetical protein
LLKTPLAAAVDQDLALYNVWDITDLDGLVQEREHVSARDFANSFAKNPVIIAERVDYASNLSQQQFSVISLMQKHASP